MAEYRNYDDTPQNRAIREFYRRHHANQSLAFVLARKEEYLPPRRTRMGIWDMIEYLEDLVDESDPDTQSSQLQHNLQTAEAMRRHGKPEWFVLTGFIHDLGKVLCRFGEPQWAVVGDTYPVGCLFSEKIVLYEFLADNPDFHNPAYETQSGIYEAHCGLDNVHLSWGHDEYLYQVVANYDSPGTVERIPPPGLAMIRYHSFYPWHHEGAYMQLASAHDLAMLPWVQEFQKYDLYPKHSAPIDVSAVKPYYEKLVAKYFPGELWW